MLSELAVPLHPTRFLRKSWQFRWKKVLANVVYATNHPNPKAEGVWFLTFETDKPKLPDSFEEDTWSKLKLCIKAVHTETPVGQSFEELYKVLTSWNRNMWEGTLIVTVMLGRQLKTCAYINWVRGCTAALKQSVNGTLSEVYAISQDKPQILCCSWSWSICVGTNIHHRCRWSDLSSFTWLDLKGKSERQLSSFVVFQMHCV